MQPFAPNEATNVGNSAEGGALTRHIGYDLLGPVFHRWLAGLHQYISYFDDGKTKFLFCARAGIRIQKLYATYLEGIGEKPASDNMDMFWVSRISVAKGCFTHAQAQCVKSIADEYSNQPISNLIEGVLRFHPETIASFDLSECQFRAHGFNFPGWMTTDTPDTRKLKEYFSECSKAFDEYVEGLTKGYSRVILIDSGWQGSAQSILKRAYPKLEWKGLYFGRILTPSCDKAILDDVIGVLFQNDTFDENVPESAFTAHRHIVETMLEPNGPSIEEIYGGEFKAIAQELIDANLAAPEPLELDPLYLHTIQYLNDNKGLTLKEIFSRHQAAMPELARVIMTPSKDEALALYCKDRSADFGKALTVPVLQISKNPKPAETDLRIKRSLWPQGQIALEYGGGIARDIQLRVAGGNNAAGYFDPKGSKRQQKKASRTGDIPLAAHVSIITRTKNRPLLLERAARAIAKQTYPHFTWVVVNDGGDEACVREIIENCAVDRRKIVLVSNSESLGMEAASNAGIGNSDDPYIVIHDDDDSWAPDFLKRTVEFLESPAGKRYGGVITHSVYVSEEIRGQTVVEHGRHPYHDWVRNVQLTEMACGNFFPPIAFVFRRSVFEEIGGYNESLPVLGDWYFNLEFLLRADIGVIPEPLANYHHRDRGDSGGIYANSVIGGVSKHEEFASIARNEFLRQNLGQFPAAAALIHGYAMTDNRNIGSRLTSHIGNQAKIKAESSVSTDSKAESDRYWVAAEVNRLLADTPLPIRLLKWRRIKGFRPDAPLETLLMTVQRARANLMPPPDFDEAGYLGANQDVANAVVAGKVPSGFIHYLRSGQREGRNRPRKS